MDIQKLAQDIYDLLDEMGVISHNCTEEYVVDAISELIEELG
jgi:hypothetical protein